MATETEHKMNDAGTDIDAEAEATGSSSVELADSPEAPVSGDAVSGDAVSGDAVSGDAVSGDAVSGDAVSGETSDEVLGDAADDEEESEDYLVEEGEIAGDYLEQLLDVLDFDGDIDLDVEGDRAIVSIDGGSDLAKLVGRKGEVLDALQELTRLAVQQSTGERSKLMLDVAGWRAGRRAELTTLGEAAAKRVLASGDSEELVAMTPFERKIVHDAIAHIDGVASESTGAEPSRRVVVLAAR